MTTGSIGPGTVFAGRYRLDDLLTESAGARFWRATDTILARSVAIHAVPSDDERAPGLLDAARVSATVTDPHLLRVLDCDDEAGITWVVNEWGDGVSLDLMLQQGTLPPSRAAWLTREVADAIAAGHAQGIAHGRLNPEAVLVTHAGAVKLIGYVVDASLQHSRPPNALYGEIDEREADVIDLAGVLYAGLTGRWPGVSPSGVPPAPREGRRPLRPRQVRAGVPRTLDVICERVLHKEASQHAMPIETAHEIAAALADFLGDSGMAAPLDIAGMHAEPTVSIHRDALTDNPHRPRGPGPRGHPHRGRDSCPGRRNQSPSRSRRRSTTRPGRVPTRWRRCTPRPSPRLPRPRSRTCRSDRCSPRPSAGCRPLPAQRRRPRRPPAQPPPLELGTRRRPRGAGSTRRRAAPATPARGSGRSPTRTRPRTTSTPARRGGAGCAPRSWSACSSCSWSPWPSPSPAVARTARRRDGTTSPSQSAGAAGGASVAIAGVRDFDPDGDPPTENPETAKNAIDGDPATTWTTLTYRGDPELGGLKPGVGLMLDLGEDREVSSMRVRFVGSPTSFDVYAAPEGVTEAPDSVDQLDRVGGQQDAPERSNVTLEPAPTTRYLLLWLTSLPETSGGFRGEIADITVRS